jgi:hypothetical protein
VDRVKHLPLHLGHDLPRVLLVPVPVQMLGHASQLDQEVTGEVFGIDLAPLFLPNADQRCLVVPHDDSGIRAANERAAALFGF